MQKILWAFLLVTLPSAVLAQEVSVRGNGVMHFEDRQYGVSFEFPEDWSYGKGMGFFIPSVLEHEDVKYPVRIKMILKEPYPKSNLRGAEFVYKVDQLSSPEQCKQKAVTDRDGKLVDAKTIHGVNFTHGSSSGFATCSYIDEDIYTAYQRHNGYLFGLSTHGICEEPVTEFHKVKESERKDVQARLDRIMATVHIKPQ